MADPVKSKWEDIERKDGFYFTFTVPGLLAATSTNYTETKVIRHPMEVLRASEVHTTAGTDAGAVTLDIQRLTGTTAPGSGTSILASTFNAKSTANTVVSKEGAGLASNRQFREGERLGLAVSGVLTALAGVSITLYCKPLGRGDYR